MNILNSALIRPWVFGVLFCALIPTYSLMYYFWGDVAANGEPMDLSSSLYFSVVTITTLGYGELVPRTGLSRFLASSEVLLGLMFAGLFMNACAYRVSERASVREKVVQETLRLREKFEYDKSLILHHDAILRFYIEQHLARVWTLLTPILERDGSTYSHTSMLGMPGVKAFSPEFRNMKDLHKPTLLLNDDIAVTSASAYFTDMVAFKAAVINFTNFAPVGRWPKLQADLLQFIYNSERLNCSAAILGNESSFAGGKKMSDIVGEQIAKFDRGMGSVSANHIMAPYLSLFSQVVLSRNFCREYVAQVDLILSQDYPS